MNTMKFCLLTCIFFISLNIMADNFYLSVEVFGHSSSYDSLKIENLTRNEVITLSNEDEMIFTALNPVSQDNSNLRVYPNPMAGNTIIDFVSVENAEAFLSVSSLDGKSIINQLQNVSPGINKFKLSLPSGFYIIKIFCSGKSYATSVLSVKSQILAGKITEFETGGNSILQKVPVEQKTMRGDLGDKILITAYSGKCTTIMPEVVKQTMQVRMKLMECKDGDGYYYPVVILGNQIWMAENVRTTRYMNGDYIGAESPFNRSQEYYSNLALNLNMVNNETYVKEYGRLYTAIEITDQRNIAPTGMRVPTANDMNKLITYLGGFEKAKFSLRTKGKTFWTDNKGTNESGFGLKGSGSKFITSYDLNSSAMLWTSSVFIPAFEWLPQAGGYSVLTEPEQNSVFKLKPGEGTCQMSSSLFDYRLSLRCMSDYDSDLSVDLSSLVVYETASNACTIKTILFQDTTHIIEKGICYSFVPNPTIDNQKIKNITNSWKFTTTLTGLLTDRVYYARAYAVTAQKIFYGNETTIKLNSNSPLIVSTEKVQKVTLNSCKIVGRICYRYEKNNIERGVFWSENITNIRENKLFNKDTTEIFNISITGLKTETDYYIQNYAVWGNDTILGDVNKFTTLPLYGTVTDVDGYTYHYITIGEQQWFLENLKAKRSHYKYIDAEYYNIYGLLYLSNSVQQNIAPKGWYVPSYADFNKLIGYLGGYAVAGGKMKDTLYWEEPNTGATNESGFLIRPGDTYSAIGIDYPFINDRKYAYFFTKTVNFKKTIISGFRFSYDSSSVAYYQISEMMYCSIRCMRNIW